MPDDQPFDPSEVTLEDRESWHSHIMRVTNNFFLYFRRNTSGLTFFEDVANVANSMNVRYGNRHPDDTRASSRRMSQTSREFLDEVERTAAEVAGSIETVRATVEHWKATDNEASAKACFRILLPIYVRLREKGYSKGDLCR